MSRYIDKDALLEKMKERHTTLARDCGNSDNYIIGFKFGDMVKLLENVPVADVQEVKHAKWAHLGGDEWCCSCCGFVKHTEGSWEKPSAKYCEDCGAKMELEGGNAEIY